MKTFVFLLMLLGLHFSLSANDVTENDAVAYVQNLDNWHNANIFVRDYSASKWLVFVDPEPLRGWEKPCYCYYVNKTLTNNQIIYTKTQQNMPPLGIFTPKVTINSNIQNAPQQIIQPNNTNTIANNNVYALILSGGHSIYSNYDRYWNDCSFIYQTLRNKYNVPKNNIYLSISDGTNPQEDMYSLKNHQSMSSPLDLDFDGLQDTQFAATKTDLNTIFNLIRTKITKNDQLFIYVIDHGGTNGGNNAYIWLWNQQKLHDYELAQMINSINCGCVNVILGQCYSGGFIDNLEGNGRVIATACKPNEPSYAMTNLPYDEFVYHWTSAIAGQDVYGNTINADLIPDSNITPYEAFFYANAQDTKDETPMYSSTPVYVGQEISLSRMPLTLDLYIKDKNDDYGSELNSLSSYNYGYLSSVWLRNNPDNMYGNEQPKLSENDSCVYIYADIHNRVMRNYIPNLEPNHYIHFYWARPSLATPMQMWRGANTSVFSEYGGYIGATMLVDTIRVGESSRVSIPWVIPKESIINFEDFDCHILARISQSYIDNEYTDNNPITTDCLTANVISNNNLSVCNSIFMNRTNSNTHKAETFFINPTPINNRFNLQILIETCNFVPQNYSFTIPRETYLYWVNNGAQLSDFSIYMPLGGAYTKLTATSPQSSINNIPLQANQIVPISIEWIMTSNIDYTKPIILKQVGYNDNKIIGMQHVYFEINDGSIEINAIEGDDSILLCANLNDNEYYTYEWLDEFGNIIGTTKEIYVSPTMANSTYYLKAYSSSNSQIKTTSIVVNPIYSIEHVSLNHISKEITVKLSSSCDGLLEIVPILYPENKMSIKTTKETANYTIDLNKDCYNGMVIINLVNNNKIVDTIKFIRN